MGIGKFEGVGGAFLEGSPSPAPHRRCRPARAAGLLSGARISALERTVATPVSAPSIYNIKLVSLDQHHPRKVSYRGDDG